MESKLSVLIADPGEDYRSALAAAFADDPHFLPPETATDGLEAVAKAAARRHSSAKRRAWRADQGWAAPRAER